RCLPGQTVCLGDPQRPCYKIAYFQEVWSRVAFREASEACRMDGGSLLSIQSPGEQKDIENLLQEMRSGAVGGAGAAGGIADGDYWIGLVRVDDHAPAEAGSTSHSCSDLYRWTDGSPASFRNWYFDEPSCGGEACVVMYHQPAALPGLGGAYLYQWNDDRCNMKHNFICKYHPEATAGGGGVKPSTEDVPSQVTTAGSSGMLLLSVILPTIPLFLLILVASGTCCFQLLKRSSRAKTEVHQPNLWISESPGGDTVEA
uniref:Chondrolectin n=1 Tax=Tetraodon nigroviridis TaxID=99883 RepID=H3CMW4_TETNG